MDTLIPTNVLLGLLAAVGGFLFVRVSAARRLRGIKQLGTTEALALIQSRGAVVVDVREDNEFLQERIPNARHIPLGQIGAKLKELEKFKDKPIVVSCRSGARSARACLILNKHGFSEVYNLKGGINAWKQQATVEN